VRTGKEVLSVMRMPETIKIEPATHRNRAVMMPVSGGMRGLKTKSALHFSNVCVLCNCRSSASCFRTNYGKRGDVLSKLNNISI
jgi:hypothetical protein